MELDPVLLARIQFALTIMFHYLFPPLTIGLGVVMVFTEGMFLKTGDRQYEAMARFWTKIFAVNFAMGVASGIVMEFQFGTNWATYSRYVGDVFGSALASEGIFAFFLESGFLAVLVFGWDRVSPKMHFFSTCMVSLGSIFSAVWIVVANSWMQTPAGYHLVENVVNNQVFIRAEITNFWELVFNPSSVIRLTHTLIGALIMGCFLVMSITGYYILKGRHLEMAKKSFKVALVLAAVASIGQLFAGHTHAKQVAEHQPPKLAAFEGHFETGKGGAPLSLFGWPDAETEQLKYAVQIPNMLSWLVHGDTSKTVAGLKDFPKDEWPPLAIPFVTYHVMVGLGMYFIGVTLLGLFLLWRGTLFKSPLMMWVFVVSVLAPYVSNQFGWIATEVGRQPWIVWNLLRTDEAVSKSVSGGEIMGSILIFTLIYAMLFAVWVYVMNDKIHQGPEDVAELEKTAQKRKGGLIEAVVEEADPGGGSFTSAKTEVIEKGEEEER